MSFTIKTGVGSLTSGISRASSQSIPPPQLLRVGKVYGVITTISTPTIKQFDRAGGFGGIGSVFFLDYNNAKVNIASRIGVGNPGARKDRSSINTVFKDGQDKVNMIPLYTDATNPFETSAYGAKGTGDTRDLIKFAFEVIDNDFTVSPWGTPLNPTYGIVTPTTPVDYYSSLEGKSGAVLKQAIQDIIANPSVVRAHNYGDVETILKKSDQNPLNSNQVWLMYFEQPRSKLDMQETGINTGKWNREHIYPQSRAGYSDGTSSIPDGINVWTTTSADDIMAGHADAHHIRAEDGAENTDHAGSINTSCLN